MKNLRKKIVSSVKRVVVKVGSRLLVDMETSSLNIETMACMAKSISALRRKGVEVVLVSSGAVGAGMAALGISERPKKLENVQSCASVGQPKLMNIYEQLFQNEGYHVGQILLTREDFGIRERYTNITNTVHSMLNHDIIPIINENDSVSIEQIKVGDNDKLGSDVTHFLDADMLIVFTDEDGLFDKNPKVHDDAELVTLVEEITPEIEQTAGKAGSAISTGGMKSKLDAIKQASEAGCHVILANGFKENPLELLEGKVAGTLFVGKKVNKSQKERWLTYVSSAVGIVSVDDGGIRALLKKHSSLLAVGVVDVAGEFHQGDLIEIADKDGNVVARGTVNFTDAEILQIMGKNSEEVSKLFENRPFEIVHKDNLVLL